MQVLHGVAYWTTDHGLLASKDNGKTWAIQGAPVDAMFGPYPGRDADNMLVVGKQGFHETRDGGKSWQLVAPLPPDYNVGIVGPNYAWDAKADIFYASSMGKDAYRYTRAADVAKP